jgi:signal transduction histidine kinase
MNLIYLLSRPWRFIFGMALPGAAQFSRRNSRVIKDTQEAVLDTLPEAALVCQNGWVTFANRRARALFAAGDAQDLRGVSLRKLLPDLAAGVDSGQGCPLNGPHFAAAWSCGTTTFRAAPAQLYVVRDATRERTLHARLQRKDIEMQRLSAWVIQAQERERRHIARELHDEIGQCLSAIRVQFAKLQRRTESPEALSLIKSAADLTETTLGRVRSLSLLLHPPQLETLGLRAALRWHIREQERLHDWRIDFNDADIGHDVPHDLAIAVYRIVQESLSNAQLHGNAHVVKIALSAEENLLRLHVLDDGCGFDPKEVSARETSTLGLLAMAERTRLLNGTLEVISAPGKGTQVLAVFPRQRGVA